MLCYILKYFKFNSLLSDFWANSFTTKGVIKNSNRENLRENVPSYTRWLLV